MHTTPKIALALCGLVATGSAGAAQADTKAALFDHLDSNHDGVISQQEMNGVKQALARNGFDRVDSDNDGRISEQEYLNKARQDAKASFKRMDTDADQGLSLVEATRLNASDIKTAARERADSPTATRVMNNMDANDDGSVSTDEWSDAIKRRSAHRSAAVGGLPSS